MGHRIVECMVGRSVLRQAEAVPRQNSELPHIQVVVESREAHSCDAKMAYVTSVDAPLGADKWAVSLPPRSSP